MMDKAEHATTSLRPALRLIEADAVNGGDVIVIDRTEGREQRGNALGAASILVPPRTTRVEAQHIANEVIRQIEGTRLEVLRRHRISRAYRCVPQLLRTVDPDVIVLAPRPLCRFTIHRCAVKPCSSQWIDAAVRLVAGLPLREAETFADIIFAGYRIVARERMNYKTPRRCWIKSDR